MLYYLPPLNRHMTEGEPGGMAEWFKAVVLKTTEALYVSGGSNPSPSAKIYNFIFGEVPEWTIGAAC